VYGGLLTVLWQSHKYDEVLVICEQGLKKAENTSRVMFHIDRAEALLALGKPDEAVAAAEAAVKDSKEKDRLLTRRTLAQTLSQAGKHDQAQAECEALLKEYNLPGDVRIIRVTLSSIHLAAHKYDESEKQLQLVLEADPNDALANNDLGYQWADRSKNLDEAEKMIRKALELDRKARGDGGVLGPDADRDNAAYIDSLGWVLFRRGQLAAAREQLELATSLPDGADDPTVWDHLGDVYFRQEEKAKALTAWKKALGLFDTGRRRADDRKKDVQKKIKLLEP
jgi:tetratricopeptide (TPR) repeat protein